MNIPKAPPWWVVFTFGAVYNAAVRKVTLTVDFYFDVPNDINTDSLHIVIPPGIKLMGTVDDKFAIPMPIESASLGGYQTVFIKEYD